MHSEPLHENAPSRHRENEWLWGWDPTPGIVSVWAEANGRATVWRRIADTGALVREEERFRPWLLLDQLDDLRHLGERLGCEGTRGTQVSYRELDGPGTLRFLVSADDTLTLTSALLAGASLRLGRHVGHLRDLPRQSVLTLPPEEQYLVSTGRTYFRDLTFDHLRRMQFDLETTGLDPRRNRIFMIAVRDPAGATEILEVRGQDDKAEADLIRRLAASVVTMDPDVIENHNLHGFDLPFLDRRARILGVRLTLGRNGLPGLRQRPAWRGVVSASDPQRRVRFVAPGRELIDTLMRSAATTSRAVICQGTGSRWWRGTLALRVQIVSSSAAIKYPRYFAVIQRACAGMPPQTWRRSRGSHDCSVAQRSHWRGWCRGGTSGLLTPALQPA